MLSATSRADDLWDGLLNPQTGASSHLWNRWLALRSDRIGRPRVEPITTEIIHDTTDIDPLEDLDAYDKSRRRRQ